MTELIVKKIKTNKLINYNTNFRPQKFDDFIGQNHIIKQLKTAINSCLSRWDILWHIIFFGPSWYWKTTLAQIIANTLGKQIKIVTWYAISKPAELITILNSLQEWDILFIDEIHRLRPNIEEILYTAMEDFVIDVVMPEWWNVRIPIAKFTLIWATTQPEKLSIPLKNRFVYQFFLEDYTTKEKKKILERYLKLNWIKYLNKTVLDKFIQFLPSTPRQIYNTVIILRDFLVSHNYKLILDDDILDQFIKWADIKDGGLQKIHLNYIKTIKKLWWWPVGIKTIAMHLGLNEKTVENDIEPILIKLGYIDKTKRWRILIKDIL